MPHQQTATAKTVSRSDKIAGGLAYFAAVPAIIFLMDKRYNNRPFVRFHSWQAIYLTIASVLIAVLLGVITDTVPGLQFLAFDRFPLVSLLLVILWIMALMKAFNGQRYKLPVIGRMADRRAGR
jgi:uncharacterized membrane protein